MPNLLIGLFLGVILGLLLGRYILPCFDWLLELFIAKLSEGITEHNLNISMMSADMFREYPELSNNPDNVGQTNLIGFQYYGEEDIYDEE
jgi:hypothetical protein